MRDLLFIHNKPTVFNIGDFLCTPQHYFDFGMNKKNNKLRLKKLKYNCVIGGGAYKNHAESILDTITAKNVVTWAIGSSENGVIEQPKIDKFHTFTTRDIAVARKYNVRFLPCVSVLSNIVDVKVGGKIGVFLNHDVNITKKSDLEEIKAYCEINDAVFGTNSFSQNEFIKLFSRTDRVITNSYHMAYWSLLSGRSVSILGYSSKFQSLIDMFEISNESMIKYDKKSKSLKSVFYEAFDSKTFYSLNDSENTKKYFRQLNIDFANELVDMGIVSKASLIKQSKIDNLIRHVRYTTYMYIKNIKNKFGV